MNLTQNFLKRLSLLAMSALLFGACATAPAPAPEAQAPEAAEQTAPAAPEVQKPADIRIDIVSTSDTHGWALPHEARLPDGTLVESGGLANLGGYLKILREKNPGGVVLVDGGDVFQGTLISNLFEGISVVEAMNGLGYDAMAIGNHEFDYGPKGPKAIAAEGDDPLGALHEVSKAAKFQVLARNVTLKGTDARPDIIDPDGFIIVERNGVKIGILGLATPDTVTTSNPVNLAGLDFHDMAAVAADGAAAMKAQGAEVIVGVFHEGNRCADLSNPKDLTSCDSERGLIQLANALPHGLFDVIVGGHTHASLGHFVNGMALIQSGAQALAFGLVELTLDGETHRPIADKTRIRSTIPICPKVFEGTESCNVRQYKEGMKLVPAAFEGEEIVPDAAVAEVLKGYADKVEAIKAEELGATVKTAMHRQYRSECPLGNALSDILRSYTTSDFSMLNSGGLRMDLEAGPVRYGDIFNILPFDNYTATLKLTGAEVVRMFEVLLSSQHGVPQVSGLKLTVEMCSDGAHVLKALDARNKPLDTKPNSKKLYTLTTSDFLASGGDGLTDFMKSLPEGRIDSGVGREKTMRDEIIDVIRTTKKIPEPGIQGRVTIVPCRDAGKAGEVKPKMHK